MNEEKKLRLTVASSPHVASPIDTTNLMRDVLIALVPAMVMGVVFFGPRALVATIISVLACEFFEWGLPQADAQVLRPSRTCPPPSPACCWPSCAPPPCPIGC